MRKAFAATWLVLGLASMFLAGLIIADQPGASSTPFIYLAGGCLANFLILRAMQ